MTPVPIRLVLAVTAVLSLRGPVAWSADQQAAMNAMPAHQTCGATQAAASSGRTPAPAGAYAYIGFPYNGATLRSTRFRVWFGLRGMGVAPAGTDKPNTGHHHLLIDTDLPPLDEPIPNDNHHLHFGLGQTETMLELPAGTHTLQLLLADANHIPFDPPVMSPKITIHVQP